MSYSRQGIDTMMSGQKPLDLTTQDGDIINHWYIICLSRELHPDRLLQRTIYDKSLVIYRDSAGLPVVMLDRCIHRGVQLSKGKCNHGELVCPYHGWKYGAKGQVTQIPSEGEMGTTRKSFNDFYGETFPSFELDGAIWVWPGDKSQVTSQPDWRFPHVNESGWVQYFMITDFQNEVTHLVQNFMDVPHTVFVHSKWFRNQRAIKVPIDIEVNLGHVKVTYRQPKDSIGFIGRILNPENKPMIHTDEYIFPNLTRVDYNFGNQHFIINSQCTPITRHSTRVYTWICYRLGTLGPLLKPFMRFYTRKVISQDVEIMENHGRNLRLYQDFFEQKKYKNSAADELHIAIDKLRELGKSNRKSAEQLSYKREREFWI